MAIQRRSHVRGATVRVMNIEQGAPVTIIGVVKTQGGAPILVAPNGDWSYVLSSFSEEELAAMNKLSPLGRALAWGLVGLGVFLLVAMLKTRRKLTA